MHVTFTILILLLLSRALYNCVHFFNGNLVNNRRQVFQFSFVFSRLHSPTSSVFYMISRLLALQFVNAFPKIMVSWTEQSIPTVIQPVLSTSKILLLMMWTLYFYLYCLKKSCVCVFPSSFFFFSFKQLHHTVGSC